MKNIFLIFTALFSITACSDSDVNSVAKTDNHNKELHYHCDNPLSYVVGMEDNCTKECPNRETNFVGSGALEAFRIINCALKECPKDKPLQTNRGDCYSCKEPAIDGFVVNCSVCSNRIGDGYECKLKKCPKDKPLRQKGGACFSCNSDNPDAEWYIENCEVCPNRIIEGRTCKLSMDSNDKAVDGKCPKDKPLKRWDDVCFACETEKAIRIDSKCDFEVGLCEPICPDREIVYQGGGNPNSYVKCPKDKPLRDSTGRCYSCDYEWGINMQLQPIKKCEQMCSNRVQKHNTCYLKIGE